MGNRLSGVTTVGPRNCAVVTPNDTVDITINGTKVAGHIRCDDAGTLRVLPEGATGNDYVDLTVAAGETTQFVVRRVYETGTTVVVIHVLF